MSRIGKKPIELPQGVEVTIKEGNIVVTGPKGSLAQTLNPFVVVDVIGGEVLVSVKNTEEKFQRALWGLYRKLVANMIEGVTRGFQKKLEINGVGYRAALEGNKLVLSLGYSHPSEFPLPEGISAQVENNQITILGTDKQIVGQVAANIRKLRKPEPYKGKGIKYAGEIIRRKAGKAAKAAA